MISDVLSDAVREIERCQRDFDDCHSDLATQIDMVKSPMDELRRHLDTPPVEPFLWTGMKSQAGSGHGEGLG